MNSSGVAERVLSHKSQFQYIARASRECREGIESLRREILAAENDQDTMRSLMTRLLSRGMAEQMNILGAARSSRRVVTNDCANFLAARVFAGGLKNGKLRTVSAEIRRRIESRIDLIMGAEQRAALTASDAPLPVEYESEIIQLVESYGVFRRWGTVFPLGRGTTKLPRLKTSPAFEFIDMSGAVPEKVPQLEFVDFVHEKAGGIVRVPGEIDADSFVDVGNFLADWIARQMAYFEDDLCFNGDGSSTYKSMSGVLQHALDEARVVTLAAGVSSPPEITLADVRAMRRHVASAAFVNGAYYFHPSYEALFCSFNDETDEGEVFKRSPEGDTLDDIPIRWVAALPVYDTADDVEALVGGFGDLAFAHLGQRGQLRIDTSRSVFFTVDQIGVRALEQVCFNQMADDAFSALQLGAAL